MEEFDQFIEDMGLVDLPLIVREYTWHQANRSCMSRIDWFLLLDEWMAMWADLTQRGL